MKKVLVVLPSLDVYSGVASHVMNYYRALKDKVSFDFAVYLNDDGRYREEILRNGSKIYSFKKGFFSARKEIKNFFEVNSKKYDIIHVHTFNYGYVFLKFAKLYGIRTRIIHIHSVRFSDNYLKHLINKLLVYLCKRKSNILVACSSLAGKKAFKNNKFKVVNNAFDITRYNCANRQKIRNELSCDDCVLFGTVGRLVWQKNPMFLMRTFNELKKENKFSNSKLLIIGDGKKKKAINKYIKRHNLQSSVIIKKDIHNIQDYYAAMDCFIFPSRNEGLGLALVEAQASGLCCFCTNTLPEEVFASRHIKPIKLSYGPKRWAEIISKNMVEKRGDNSLRSSVFDINTESLKLLNVYNSAHKKKVLHIVPVLQNGGTEKYLINLLKGTNKEYINEILVYDERNHWKQLLDEMNIKTISITKPSATGIVRNYKLVKKIIREENPDIVYSYTYYNVGITSLAAKRAGVKQRIVHVHTSATDHVKTISYKIYCNLCRLLIMLFSTDRLACSVEAGKTLFVGNKFSVIKNGIDLKRYAYNSVKRREIRKQLGIKKDIVLIGVVGRIDANKNQKYAIDVFKEYSMINKKSAMVIIGDGPERQIVKEYAKKTKLPITIMSNIENIEDYYSALDVLLVTSKKEGLPFVCIEAEANGLSVFSSTAVSNSAKINDNFIFLDINDNPKKWASVISRNTLHHCLPNIKINEYSIDAIASNLKSIYDIKGF